MAPENIRIYTALDSSTLVTAQAPLADIFANRTADADVTLAISDDGSRIWFEDKSILWSNPDPTRLPQTTPDVERAVKIFTARINTAAQQVGALKSAGITRIFPDDIRSSFIGVASDPDTGAVDHWLARYDTYLPSDTTFGSVQVLGAIVEFRVGTDGNVGGCWLNWRSCVPKGTTPLISLSSTDQTASDPSNSDGSAPVLLYRVADEGQFIYLQTSSGTKKSVSDPTQSFVARYFFTQDDDDGVFYPASAYSPVISIVPDPTSEGLALAAQVVGGSGQYGYSWASMDATLIWGAPVDLGNDPGVTLDLGVYTVFLRVTDLGPSKVSSITARPALQHKVEEW